MSPCALVLQAVHHRYPRSSQDTPAPVSFQLAPGERAILTGPNGSGKTTLLLRIVGLLDGPGTIQVDGLEPRGRALLGLRRRVGFLWQSPEDGLLLPTPREDVALGLLHDGHSSRDAYRAADEWLEHLGLARLARRSIHDLSSGETQLVALAGLLVRKPGLLLLDEPSSALDADSREILDRALTESPATQLLATHDPTLWSSESERPLRRIRVRAGPVQEESP